MGKHTFLFLTFSVISAFLSVSYGCKCLRWEAEEVACKSDIVVKALAKNCRMYDDKKICRFLVKQVLKGKHDFIDRLENNGNILKADAMSGTDCEVYPVNGTIYIIAQNLNDDGSIFLSGCSYFKPWAELQLSERNGFNCTYYKFC